MSLHLLIREFFFTCRRFILPNPTTGKEAQTIIADMLRSSSPCMIGRFGSVEIQATLNGVLPPRLICFYKIGLIPTYSTMPDFSL